MSGNQLKFAIKDESRHSISIKKECDLLSVKEEPEFAMKDESCHSIKEENDLLSVKEEPEFAMKDESRHSIKEENDLLYVKEEPEELVNSFQPYGTVQRKADDSIKVEYDDKTIIIKKETIGDTVFESEIVIEESGIQSILNGENCNTGHDSNFTDLPRTIYKDLVNCNNTTDQNKSKREKRIYVCDVCHQSFISKQLLISHMRDHFPNNDYCTNNNSKRVCSKNIKCKKIKIKRTKKTIFSCPICGKEFNDQSNCRRHTINHNNNNNNNHTNKVKCLVCGKQLANQYNLRVHMRIHTGESPYECDICHLTFQRNDNLSKHRKNIHEVNQKTYYVCKDCHKQFLHNNSLLRHVRTHQMEYIYSCHHCQRPYTRKDSLIVHLRSRHTGEKPYQCHICKKDFFENSVLGRHMRIHKKGKKN